MECKPEYCVLLRQEQERQMNTERDLAASEQALAMSELSYHNLEEAMVVELENHNEQLKQLEQALSAERERFSGLKSVHEATVKAAGIEIDALNERAEQAGIFFRELIEHLRHPLIVVKGYDLAEPVKEDESDDVSKEKL